MQVANLKYLYQKSWKTTTCITSIHFKNLYWMQLASSFVKNISFLLYKFQVFNIIIQICVHDKWSLPKSLVTIHHDIWSF